MENGLYHAVITLPDDVTNSVVSIRDGYIEGGDSVSCFSGTINVRGAEFTAKITAKPYAELDRYLPVFGSHPVHLTVEGRVIDSGSAAGTVSCRYHPRINAQIQLRRLRFDNADLSCEDVGSVEAA